MASIHEFNDLSLNPRKRPLSAKPFSKSIGASHANSQESLNKKDRPQSCTKRLRQTDMLVMVDRLNATELEGKTQTVTHTWSAKKKQKQVMKIKRISNKAFKRLLGAKYERFIPVK